LWLNQFETVRGEWGLRAVIPAATAISVAVSPSAERINAKTRSKRSQSTGSLGNAPLTLDGIVRYVLR